MTLGVSLTRSDRRDHDGPGELTESESKWLPGPPAARLRRRQPASEIRARISIFLIKACRSARAAATPAVILLGGNMSESILVTFVSESLAW